MANEHDNRVTQDDYLWDGFGRPDPEIQHLERALGRFRHNRPTPTFAQIELPARRLRWWSEIAASAWTPRFAAVLLVVSAIGLGLWLARSPRTPVFFPGGWGVGRTLASPTC